jgi:NAD(P)-dependent dehydrogenase (short-subunit alcohol dehydrogenase family)
MDLRIKGKTALITGGSRGIGFGAARLFAEAGCNLHLVGRNAASLATAREAIIGEYAVDVQCHAVDISVGAEATALAQRLSSVDILINNAGSIPRGSIAAMDTAAILKAWELKLFGFINMTREIYAAMCERRRGVIVNVIGASGERPEAGYIAGSIANAGLMAMTRALGAESPKFGVRVLAVNPGATETERQTVRWEARGSKELGDPQRWRELTKGLPFDRLATVDEVASTIVFLASDRPGYITGTIVTVDGGKASRR